MFVNKQTIPLVFLEINVKILILLFTHTAHCLCVILIPHCATHIGYSKSRSSRFFLLMLYLSMNYCKHYGKCIQTKTVDSIPVLFSLLSESDHQNHKHVRTNQLLDQMRFSPINILLTPFLFISLFRRWTHFCDTCNECVELSNS